MSGLCLVLGLALALGCGKEREPGAAEGSAAAGPVGEPTAAGEPAAPAAGGGDEAAEEAKRSKAETEKKAIEAAQQADKVLAYVREPMTAADVEATLKFVKAWRADPTFVRARDAWKEMQEATDKKDDSTAGEMRKTRTVTKMAGAVDNLEDAYDALIVASGGPERHFGRSARVGGVVAGSAFYGAAVEVAKETPEALLSK